MAAVTYGLVIAAVGAVVGGFFMSESNVLLFVAIGLSVAALALIVFGWARRSREAPIGFESEDLSFDDPEFLETDEEDDALLGALDEQELAFIEDVPQRSSRRTASRSTSKRSSSKGSSSKPRARKTTASSAKAKPKPKAKAKAKAQAKAKPAKRKPPRPRR